MSATHYLLTVTYGTKAANKLQEGIYEDLKLVNRILVTADLLDKLKADIIEVIEEKNTTFNKCKPVKVSWFDMDREDALPSYHLSLNGLTFMYVKILGVKEVEL